MTTARRIAAIGVVLLATLAACALPTDDSAQVIAGDEVESAMRPTTTSTTVAVGTTRDHKMFYFDEDELLIAELRETPSDTGVAEILTILSQPREEFELRSSVPEDFVVTTTELDDGVLTVVLADDALFELGGSVLARAVAQIVVTATELSDEIQEVRFVLDDEVRDVPAGPELNDTDEPVDACDYRQFLREEDCTDIS